MYCKSDRTTLFQYVSIITNYRSNTIQIKFNKSGVCLNVTYEGDITTCDNFTREVLLHGAQVLILDDEAQVLISQDTQALAKYISVILIDFEPRIKPDTPFRNGARVVQVNFDENAVSITQPPHPNHNSFVEFPPVVGTVASVTPVAEPATSVTPVAPVASVTPVVSVAEPATSVVSVAQVEPVAHVEPVATVASVASVAEPATPVVSVAEPATSVAQVEPVVHVASVASVAEPATSVAKVASVASVAKVASVVPVASVVEPATPVAQVVSVASDKRDNTFSAFCTRFLNTNTNKTSQTVTPQVPQPQQVPPPQQGQQLPRQRRPLYNNTSSQGQQKPQSMLITLLHVLGNLCSELVKRHNFDNAKLESSIPNPYDLRLLPRQRADFIKHAWCLDVNSLRIQQLNDWLQLFDTFKRQVFNITNVGTFEFYELISRLIYEMTALNIRDKASLDHTRAMEDNKNYRRNTDTRISGFGMDISYYGALEQLQSTQLGKWKIFYNVTIFSIIGESFKITL